MDRKYEGKVMKILIDRKLFNFLFFCIIVVIYVTNIYLFFDYF